MDLVCRHCGGLGCEPLILRLYTASGKRWRRRHGIPVGEKATQLRVATMPELAASRSIYNTLGSASDVGLCSLPKQLAIIHVRHRTSGKCSRPSRNAVSAAVSLRRVIRRIVIWASCRKMQFSARELSQVSAINTLNQTDLLKEAQRPGNIRYISFESRLVSKVAIERKISNVSWP